MAENPKHEPMQVLPDAVPEDTVSVSGKAKSSRTVHIIVFLGILLCAAAVLFYFRYWIPASQYKTAENLMQAEEYAQAYSVFNTLKFRDSSRMADACLYQVQKDNLSDVAAGAKVYLGHYEQDNVISDGKEPIEWTVLDVDGNRALLISSYILDCQPYNTEISDNIWGTSALRKWLNTAFCSDAFGEDLQKMLIQDPQSGDRVSLLSHEDLPNGTFVNRGYGIRNYYDDYEKMKCSATAYAQSGGLYPNESGFCSWWLRPWQSSEKEEYGDAIWKNGGAWMNSAWMLYNGSRPPVYTQLGVRPIIWISLDYAPLVSNERAEAPAPSSDADPFGGRITEKNALDYLKAAISNSAFIVEGTVRSRRTYDLNGLKPSMETIYTLNDLTVLSGSCEENELRILVPGIASAFEFEEGRRYIVIINPTRLTSHYGEGDLYQGYQIRCLLDYAHPDLIERLIAGGYPTEALKSRQEMLNLIQSTDKKEPDNPENGSESGGEMNEETALDYLKAALERSSFVAECTIQSKHYYPAHTYDRAYNEEPVDEYIIQIHEIITGFPDAAGTFFTVPADDPATQFEIGRRYIVIVESDASVYSQADGISFSCTPIICRVPVPNPDGLIDKLIINGYQADFIKSKQDLLNIIDSTVGIVESYYNPKDYYCHYEELKVLIEWAQVITQIQVMNIEDDPDPNASLYTCKLMVDVWKGINPCPAGDTFKIRAPIGSMEIGKMYTVLLQKHPDSIDRNGNPVYLDTYRQIQADGTVKIVNEPIYENVARRFWIYSIDDLDAERKIAKLLY